MLQLNAEKCSMTAFPLATDVATEWCGGGVHERYESITRYDEFRNSRSATSNNCKSTTDIKPTHIYDPTTAAGTPPDRPADADAADTGFLAGVPGIGGRLPIV
jgi:hypothetical protein